MAMTSEQYRAINNLLAHLRDFDVLELVDECFVSYYANPCPGELLREDIQRLQTLLQKELTS